jgi:hypothetical protein
MTERTPFLRNLSLANEDAYILASELEDKKTDEVNGCTIYSGKHPEFGNIHIVIPALGDAKALFPFELKPVVLQSF